ncbi:MAG: CapA family protein [Oscillospiraceae bacterium]
MRAKSGGVSAAIKRICTVSILAVLLAVLIFVGCSGINGNGSEAPAEDSPSADTEEGTGALEQNPTQPAQEAVVITPSPDTRETQTDTEEDQPSEETYILSFAGDCTLGTEYASYGTAGSFVQMVGDDYSYPFESALPYFADDDFTMVNLECALTQYNVPKEKTYRFRGPPEYAKILTAGNVECVSLANNHSGDYGQQGLFDTCAALESEGVLYASDGGSCIYETERGLKIGVCAYFSNIASMKKDIQDVRDKGADIIVVSLHFGDEGSYSPNTWQKTCAHNAIDYGADIVFGHHPHVLEKIEKYGDGVIYYSLGNFSFGGNRNPDDKDTAIIRQYVTVAEDGTVTLGETAAIPFCLSSSVSVNTYKPTPYEEGSSQYTRVLSKLDGTYVPPYKPPVETDNSGSGDAAQDTQGEDAQGAMSGETQGAQETTDTQEIAQASDALSQVE